MSRKSSRREFMQTTAMAGVGYFVAAGVAPRESLSANEQIAFASIGVEGKGSSDSGDANDAGDMVAICDVDESSLDKAKKRFPKAKVFFDYRKMLEETGMTIDAVTVSTPDHTHAPASVMAMRLGKHCFCQKPMTHTLQEARLMGEIAREKKLATQMGNQGTADSSLREAAAVIKAGACGAVKEVHVWTNRPVWPQGLDRPTEIEPIPATLHWDEWLGCAPDRPYSKVYHPFKWRGWWAFGTGALGDMACHTLNMPYMALNLRDPVSVQAETSGHNKETYPAWSVIKYEFPALDNRPALTFVWYDGGKRPPQELFHGANVDSSGCLVIGDKDTLYAPGDYAEKGTKLLSGAEKPKVEFPKSPGHFKEWVRAIKGGEPAMSNFATYAAGLTETVLLGNLAVWASGEKVLWDAKTMTAKCSQDVSHIIKKEYRKGYSI